MENSSGSLQIKRKRLGLFGGPVIFLVLLFTPVPEALSPEAWRAAAVAVLMAVWWVTEALPLAATALLPVFLLPVLGIGSVEEATRPFANPLIYLFLGGFIIALAMEKTGLHKRIALNIVLFIGSKPTSIILGMMVATAFLSMWVSNTATAMMMLPISLSIISLLDSQVKRDASDRQSNFAVGMLLGLAYACNIGGIATLIGTPPNAFMAGYLLETYQIEIGFSQWMMVGLPLVLISLPVIFLLLTKFLYPVQVTSIPGGRELIQNQLEKSGTMKKPEIMVAAVFVVTAALWIFRPILQNYIPNLSDTGIAIFGALSLFILPVNFKKYTFILDWEDTRKLPWGILVLFGGGLSLAQAISSTGLSEWIGQSLQMFDFLPILVLMALALLIIIFLTELTSNTATAAAFLPIMASVSIAMGYSPLLLVVPAAIGASCAFMLPVATPPNAIVFGSGHLNVPQMAKAGFVVNLLMVFMITGVLYLIAGVVFGIVM